MAVEQPEPDTRRNAANARTAISLAAVVCGMVGLAFASVPLYELFCRVTGFGGTTQVADSAPEMISDRRITVRFNADVSPKLPWDFKPEETSVELRVGEPGLAFYVATNEAARPTTGTANFNVTPDKAGIYFSKVQCFCFEEQELKPGESMRMGVSFFVDPALLDDPGMADVETITLSYTFFRDLDDLAREEEETASVADYQTTTAAN